MKFFMMGNFKNSKPIWAAILFFVFFVVLFWIGNFIHFGLKFGYSIEGVENYFFGEPDFPLEISISQVAEESHINLFVFALLFLSLSALLVYADLSLKLKYFLISLFAVSGLSYTISDFLILYLGREFAFLKIVIFFVFQTIILLIVLISLLKSSNIGKNANLSKLLAIIVFIFAIFNICFVALNFILFISKIGFKITDVVNYYLGDPQKFTKPKTIIGLVEISQVHFLPMALYLITLSHFVFLVNDRFNKTLTFLLFSSALLDNVSGILIVSFSSNFAVIKMASFISLQILLLLSSVILIYKLLILKFNFPNRARI